MLYATMTLLFFAVQSPSEQADPYESALAAAIHHFAREGNLKHLEAILGKHPRLVDAPEPLPPGHKPYGTEGYTPLDWAADRGHALVADFLIRHGAKVNAADNAGWTPVLLASRRGHLDLVKLLVEHGADVGAKTNAMPETSSDSLPGQAANPGEPPAPPVKYPAIPSRTALDWAEAMGHAEVVKYLKSLKE